MKKSKQHKKSNKLRKAAFKQRDIALHLLRMAKQGDENAKQKIIELSAEDLSFKRTVDALIAEKAKLRRINYAELGPRYPYKK